MRYSLIPATLLATAVAGDVSVVWQHRTDTNTNSLSIVDPAKGDIIDHACGSVLGDHVDFSLVGDDGTGNFTAAGQDYRVHALPAYSGGPSCVARWNQRSTVVECSGVPWEGDAVARRSLSRRALDECFDEGAQPEFRMLRARGIAGQGGLPDRPARRDRTKRQQGVPPIQHTIKRTEVVGDGSPGEWSRHEQMTDGIFCADGTCSASWTEGESFTIGFTASITPFEWISAGFSVSQSTSWSRGYSCNGSNDEEVCVWFNAHMTGYWVVNTESIGGQEMSRSEEFEIRSPNDDNSDGGFFCERGGQNHCGDPGQVIWYSPL